MLHNPNVLWEKLDRLERPDVILASPPCESWSVASAMKGGNACWKQEKDMIVNIFGEYEQGSAYGRIWDYIKEVIGFNIPYENLTYYNNYDYPIKKPTKFGSNIDLKLLKDDIKNTIKFNKLNITGVNRYNTRSNIPSPLIKDILTRCDYYITRSKGN